MPLIITPTSKIDEISFFRKVIEERYGYQYCWLSPEAELVLQLVTTILATLKNQGVEDATNK